MIQRVVPELVRRKALHLGEAGERWLVLREWCAPLLAADDAPALARRYCALLAAESGLDETAIWEWGFLERVSTGLYLLDFGATSLGGRYLRTAELLAS
jgi:streptomycin 6-kinase